MTGAGQTTDLKRSFRLRRRFFDHCGQNGTLVNKHRPLNLHNQEQRQPDNLSAWSMMCRNHRSLHRSTAAGV
jgi:hypothetical protein